MVGMRIAIPVLLTMFVAPLAAAQAVRVDAAPWLPDGGPARVMPTDPGRTPLAEKQAPQRKAQSHLHPGDAQRRQDERDLADAIAAQQSANAESAIAVQKMQREIQNQQFSNEMRAEQAQRDRAALQFQLNAQQQNFIPLQLPRVQTPPR